MNLSSYALHMHSSVGHGFLLMFISLSVNIGEHGSTYLVKDNATTWQQAQYECTASPSFLKGNKLRDINYSGWRPLYSAGVLLIYISIYKDMLFSILKDLIHEDHLPNVIP